MRDILLASFKTGSGSAISTALAAVAHKMIAVVLGPVGLGLYSVLNQINITASTAASVGGGTAVVQGIASREGRRREDYIVTVFWIMMAASVLVAIGLLVFAPLIAAATLGSGDEETVNLVRLLAIPLVLSALLAYFRGVLNGFRAIGYLAISQALVAFTLAAMAFPASESVEEGNTSSFVWMIAVSVGIGVAFSVGIAYRKGFLRPLTDSHMRPKLDSNSSRHFLSIALTTLVTGLTATGVVLMVRSMVVQQAGLEGAGIFNVAWTIGMTYAMIVLSSFGTYYLPTLSQEKAKERRVTLMRKMLKVSSLMMAPLLIIAIVLKPLIVQVLYSGAFEPALETLRWMLVADYLKAGSWVLAMPMIACAQMRTYFATEIAWHVGFLALSGISLLLFESIEGIGVAFLVLYCCYSTYVYFYARRTHGFSATSREYTSWLAGLGLILAASYFTWNSVQVDWVSVPIWILMAILFVWVSLTRAERFKVVHILGRNR